MGDWSRCDASKASGRAAELASTRWRAVDGCCRQPRRSKRKFGRRRSREEGKIKVDGCVPRIRQAKSDVLDAIFVRRPLDSEQREDFAATQKHVTGALQVFGWWWSGRNGMGCDASFRVLAAKAHDDIQRCRALVLSHPQPTAIWAHCYLALPKEFRHHRHPEHVISPPLDFHHRHLPLRPRLGPPQLRGKRECPQSATAPLTPPPPFPRPCHA